VKYKAVLFFLFSILQSSFAFGQWEAILGMQVKEALGRFGLDLKGAVDNAGAQGNYVVENAANKGNLLLQNAYYLLDKQLDKRVSQLSQEKIELVRALYNISDQVNRSMEGVLELEDFVVLDIENIINQIPLKNDVYYVRRIQGYAISHQNNGIYTVKITGGAFGPGFINDIKVNNVVLDRTSFRTPRAHTLEFDIPVQLVNGLFADISTARIPITVSCKKMKRRFLRGEKLEEVFNYQDKLILLPLFPVTSYLFDETYKSSTWSDDVYLSAEGHTVLERTGEEGEEHKISGSVSATIPDGCLMVGEVPRADPGTHMRWGDPVYTNENKTVTRSAEHWIHDRPTHIYIAAKYRKPVPKVETKALQFTENGSALVKLKYGTYIADFDEEYRNFTLTLNLFNGKTYVITPTSPNLDIYRFRIEPSGNSQRIVLDIKDPVR
jgi:hypothetical protein